MNYGRVVYPLMECGAPTQLLDCAKTKIHRREQDNSVVATQVISLREHTHIDGRVQTRSQEGGIDS